MKTKFAGYLIFSIALATLVIVPVTAQTGPVFSASTTHGPPVSNSTSATSEGLSQGRLGIYPPEANASSVLAQEFAAANGNGLRASAHMTVNAPLSPGLCPSCFLSNNGTARVIFNDFIITGPGFGSVPGSGNFHLDGTVGTNATLFGVLGPSIGSTVNLSISGSIAGNAFSGTYSQFKGINCCSFDNQNPPVPSQDVTMGSSGTGILSSSGPLLTSATTPDFNLPKDTFFSVDVTMSANASAIFDIAGTAGGLNAPSFNMDSLADFSNTLSFPSSGPVFNLPPGFTLNSVQAHIVNNHFVSTDDENQPPIASCRSITRSVGNDCGVTIVPGDVDNGSSDPDSTDTIMLSLDNAGPFGLGIHTVMLTATDSHNSTNSCAATITVIDDSAPRIVAPSPTSAYSDINCQAAIPNVLPQASATDNCDMVSLAQSPVAGTLVGVGTHIITITATDGSNNSQAATTSFTVKPIPSFTVSVTPTSVKPGGKVTFKTAFRNCATVSQALILKVSLTRPGSNTLMLALPITLRAAQIGSFSIPLRVPKSSPTGLYSLTLDVYLGGVKIGTSTAQLTVIP